MLLRIGNGPTSAADAFDYARAMGADVINNSWSFAAGVDADLEDRIEEAASNGRAGRGSVIVFSMTNIISAFQEPDRCTARPDLSSLDSVIAVGASTDEDKRAWFSSVGACLDLLAPGAPEPRLGVQDSTRWGITTTDSVGLRGYNSADAETNPNRACPSGFELNDNDYTGCFGGTSAAAPIVAGTAALMLSADPTLTRLEVQDILQRTAAKIQPGSGPGQANYDATSGHSTTHGYGRVNAFCALRAVVAPDEPCEGELRKPETRSGAVEIGTRLGITTLSATNDQVIVNGPGSGPLAAPVFYVDWFPGQHLMLEAQLGFSNISNSGGTPDARSLVGVLQPAYLFYAGGTQLFVGPSAAVQYLDVGGVSNTDYAFGGAFGYRFRPRPFLAIRVEGRYRYWTNQNIHEVGLALGVGVVLN